MGQASSHDTTTTTNNNLDIRVEDPGPRDAATGTAAACVVPQGLALIAHGRFANKDHTLVRGLAEYFRDERRLRVVTWDDLEAGGRGLSEDLMVWTGEVGAGDYNVSFLSLSLCVCACLSIPLSRNGTFLLLEVLPWEQFLTDVYIYTHTANPPRGHGKVRDRLPRRSRCRALHLCKPSRSGPIPIPPLELCGQKHTPDTSPPVGLQQGYSAGAISAGCARPAPSLVTRFSPARYVLVSYPVETNFLIALHRSGSCFRSVETLVQGHGWENLPGEFGGREPDVAGVLTITGGDDRGWFYGVWTGILGGKNARGNLWQVVVEGVGHVWVDGMVGWAVEEVRKWLA